MEGGSVFVRIVDEQLGDTFNLNVAAGGTLDTRYLPQDKKQDNKYEMDPAKVAKDRKTLRKSVLPKDKNEKEWIKEMNKKCAELTEISHYQF